ITSRWPPRGPAGSNVTMWRDVGRKPIGERFGSAGAIDPAMVPLRAVPPAGAAVENLDVAKVFRDHGRDIERWAARLGGPLVDAEDVAQDVLAVVNRRLGEFRPDAQLTTWLSKITHTIATTPQRREPLGGWLRG